MDEPREQTGASEIDPVIEAYKKDIDRTQLRENLRLTVQERFEKLQRMAEMAEELRRAMRNARGNQKNVSYER